MKPIEITFDIEQRDMEALFRDYYLNTPQYLMPMRIVQIAFPVGLALTWLFIWWKVGAGTALNILTIMYIPAAVLGYFYMPWRVKKDFLKKYRKHLAASGASKAYGSYIYKFEDDGIFSKGPLGEGKSSWLAVEKTVSAKDHLHIIISGGKGLPISRAQVPPETLQELQAAIEEKLQKGGDK